MDFLKGKRTYICAALLFLVGGLEAIEVLPPDAAAPLKTLFMAGSIAALRGAKQ